MEQKDHGVYCQRNIKVIRDKVVHHIQEDLNGGFYLITSGVYDTEIHLEHTNKITCYYSIQRSVEPGVIKMFDFFISTETSQNQINSQMEQIQTKNFQLINMNDEEFYINKVSYQEGIREGK